jgi:hypothetical protein
VEAQLVTLFQKGAPGKDYNEAHAIAAIRKSAYVNPFLYYDLDDYTNLFRQNPVTHPLNSSLSPKRYSDYDFWMDTTDYPGYYLVHYRCEDYASDNHGVTNFFDFNRHGAAREEGTLKIEKQTFALMVFERKAHRNPNYEYPFNDNYLLPDRQYKLEFDNSYLKIEWVQKGGQWVVNQMLYHFTNDFRSATFHSVDYTISEYFEWYAMEHSRYVGPGLLSKLYKKPALMRTSFPYDPTQWNRLWPAYQFVSKQRIEDDIRGAENGELFQNP